MFQRHNLHSHSVSFFFFNFICDVLNHLLFVPVFKRGKSTPMLGAFHASDIPEFYGFGVNPLARGEAVDVKPDFIGTDALGMFSGLCSMCC